MHFQFRKYLSVYSNTFSAVFRAFRKTFYASLMFHVKHFLGIFSCVISFFNVSRETFVAVHICVSSNGILPMPHILNRQDLLSELYRTEFSVQKIFACEQLQTFLLL